jgi:hypothetical protein
MIGMRSGLIAIAVAVLTIAVAPAGTAATPDVRNTTAPTR